MEAVVTTDWHLDLLNNIFHNDPELGIKLQIKDIEKPFEYALDNGIKDIIVPGDIGQHSELSSHAKIHLLSLLLKYDNVLNVHIIPGNHDYNRVGLHSLKLVELLCKNNKFNSVFLYSEPTKVKIGGKYFNFLPYPHMNGKDNCINIGHFEPKGAVRDNGKKVTKGQELENLWILGHLHTYQNLDNIIIPGTLYQCKFGEKNPKGFVHIRYNNNKLKHKFLEIKPSFTFNTIYIEDAKDWLNISKRETDFYRVYLSSNITVPENIYNASNIIQIAGNIEENLNSEESDMESDLKLIEDDEENLKLYLKEHFNLNKGKVNRSLKLIKEAREKFMPELPEIEVAKLKLSKFRFKIENFEIKGNLYKGIPNENELSKLKGKNLERIERIGKYIILHFEGKYNLIFHFGMTGMLYINNNLCSYKHEILRIEGKNIILSYVDTRKFGSIVLLKNQDLNQWINSKNLGIDILKEDYNTVYKVVKNRLKSNKTMYHWLMDQSNIVGIGNIYANEILYKLRIHPDSKAKYHIKKYKKLVACCKLIFKKSIIHGGSSIKDFKNPEGKLGNAQRYHQVYNKEGYACRYCENPIIKIKKGRSKYLCDKCQLLE